MEMGMPGYSKEKGNFSRPSPVAPAGLNSHKEDDYSKTNLLQIPSITMPKGGGALKSIDEKFQVNPANGTASINIALPFSKSRSDLAPQLSLAYNSGSGNTAFGLGWNINLPSIRRRTDKLLPQYWDADERDVFQLTGAEDLVPAMVQDSKGDWSPDSFTSGTYLVKRYRPRIESLFMLIEKITLPTGVYWKTTTKQNIVTFYGISPQGRITDPADPTHIFEWLPEITYDDKGGCYQYFYTPEDMTNVPSLLHEGNRLSDLQPFANTYLKSLRYANTTPYDPTAGGGTPDPWSPVIPDGSGYLFQLVLDYGDHHPDTPAPVPDMPWPARLDPFSRYKSGFEIRTYRLCRRILLFHHFKELDTDPAVVRSLDLAYRYFDFQPAPDPYLLTFAEADLLVSITETGWLGNGATGYRQKSYPPMAFDYNLPVWNTSVQNCYPENIPNIPEGLSRRYQFTDLWNEGIAGILSEHPGGWYYNSNLGGGVFTPASAVCPKPSFMGLNDGSLQLQNLTGDGRKFIVNTRPPNLGFFEISEQQEPLPFKAFDRYPRVSGKDPNIKFIDLNGDGMTDLVLSEEEVFTWWPAAGIAGYDSPLLAPKSFDEEEGPAIVFADPVESIFLADMTGDGLSDIVRIRNGELSYWPNMGYGKFGAKVNMTNAPVFDDLDRFNPAYLRLADINGTGATDLIYLGKDVFCAWLNLSGNAWGPAVEIGAFPATASPNELSVADLLGNGTASIIWSSPLADNADSPLRYIDLMGGNKPYLLNSYTNGMGKQVSLSYRSSTWFYLQDKLAGTPWITKLPFPVHCVAGTLTHDTISGSSYASGYSYHHGYYDHPEKEFRGFGRVDQTDTDSFDTNAAADQAPILTKTWFHTGAYFGIHRILHQLSYEYFQNPAFSEYQLPNPVLPTGLNADEVREALRACKGMVLRQEVYALDAAVNPALAPFPYSVIAHNDQIVLLQPKGDNLYASFLVTESEKILYHYERNPADPRIAHTLNTAFDPYGNLLESYSVVYARQPIDAAHPGGMTLPGGQPLPGAVMAVQQNIYILCNKNSYTGAIISDTGAGTYRLPVGCEAITYEVTGITPAGQYFSSAELIAASGASFSRLKHQRSLFLANDLTTPLPLYSMDTMGITWQTYHLALDATVTALNGKADATMLLAARYIRSDDYITHHYFPVTDASGEWWVPSGTIQYLEKGAPLPFYLPFQYVDAYGYATTLTYDAYWLLIASISDPLDNITSVTPFDYRVLAPKTVLDPNGNATDFQFDTLGLVVGIALRGKGEGDVFDAGFTVDLTDPQIAGFFSDPITQGPALIQGATSRYVYQFPSVADPGIPFSAGAVTRRLHANAPSDPRIDPSTPPYQYSFDYSDGLGRIAMKKIQADIDAPTDRWIGNGKAVYNNKGKPVMQYESYFSATPGYEEAPANGVTPVAHYDPEGRVIRTDFADGSFSMTQFDAWVEIAYDPNDTVKDSSWYAINSVSSDPLAADAATKAAAHYNTPTANHLDPLGRNFYSVAFNITGGSNAFYAIQTVLDLNDNPLQVIDALGNTVMQYDYDLLNRAIHQLSMDAGSRWVLRDYMDKPVEQWDVNGASQLFYRYTYDGLHRPLNSYVQIGSTTYLHEYNVYGEGISINGAADTADNLRGRLYRQFDGTGMITNYLYDFKGNLVQSSRVFSSSYKSADGISPAVNWSGVSATDLNQLEHDPVSHLLREYTSLQLYDAANRSLLRVRPFIPADAAIGTIIPLPYDQAAVNHADVVIPGYGASGALNTVNVYYQGGPLATPFVSNILHNEKGQRQSILYGNNTVTKYYYDKNNFRLIRLVTTRNKGADLLQDLNYYYDPVGNVTYLLDKAQPPIFYNNQQVLSDGNYTYDALYRLVSAAGREQIAQNTVDEGPSNTDYRNYPFDGVSPLPSPSDALAMRGYTQLYSYDASGNMTKLQHVAGAGSYTRTFAYNNNTIDRTALGIPAGDPMNNQLLATTVGANPPVRYAYDGHGNMLNMPQLPSLTWNFRDELAATTQQAMKGASTGQTTYYGYDDKSHRTRKVTEGAVTGGGSPVRQSERRYLGDFEIYQAYDTAGNLVLQRETLLLEDDTGRFALADNKTVDTGHADTMALNTWYPRYQYDNQLGSVSFELDDTAKTIAYEEYHPFGTSSFQAADASLDIPARRYRYAGKERDEESGLYYYGARYYAPWLCRWIIPDKLFSLGHHLQKGKKQKEDGKGTASDGGEEDNDIMYEELLNLYRANKNNPVTLTDLEGNDPVSKGASIAARALARRFFREMGERLAARAERRIARIALKELAEGLLPKVEKHILEHTGEVAEKAVHTMFKSGLGKEEVVALIKETIQKGGKPILSEMSENGKIAWVFEREFKDEVGRGGQKVLRVVVDKEGKVVTAFPVNSLLNRIATKGILVSAQLAVIAILTTVYESESQAAEADTASRYRALEKSKTKFETALEWIVPFGLAESSQIALEPNFNAIRKSTQDAISHAETELGRSLTPEEKQQISSDIYNIWAEATNNYHQP